MNDTQQCFLFIIIILVIIAGLAVWSLFTHMMEDEVNPVPDEYKPYWRNKDADTK